MNRIALIIDSLVIYWSTVITVMAIFTGVLFYLGVYSVRKTNLSAAFAAVPVSFCLSIVLARVLHWYFLADSYDSFLAAVTDYSSGSYALLGAFAGCLLSAVLFRLLKFENDLLHMLDSMCAGGSAAIAVGRLAAVFTSEDRGPILMTAKNLPVAYRTFNAVSGEWEYRFATFFIQALVAAMILLILLLITFSNRKGKRGGTATQVFLLLYCASQIVLDSTRYDSLRLRSNGFISVVQLVCAVTLLALFSSLLYQLIKSGNGKCARYFLVPTAVLLLAGAGFMEYFVQRYGERLVIGYGLMSLFLVLFVGMCLQMIRMKTIGRARS